MKAFGLALERDPRDHVVGFHARFVEAAKQRDHLADRFLVGEAGFLERDADPLADLDFVGTPARPRISTSPDVGRIEALQDLDGRRLARAVGAEQAEALALPDLQIDPVDRVDRSVAAGVLLAEILDADRPLAHPALLDWSAVQTGHV